MSLIREVDQGSLLPTGFGIAWRRWETGRAVCMPMPLNLVAGAARRLWFAIKHGVSPHKLDRALEGEAHYRRLLHKRQDDDRAEANRLDADEWRPVGR